MSRGIVVGLALVFLSAATGASLAQETGDAGRGRVLAGAICGACHATTGRRDEVPILRSPAPSFLAIVQRSDFSEEFIRTFLASKHQTLGPREAMPNPELMDYQVKEIVAYMLSLKHTK